MQRSYIEVPLSNERFSSIPEKFQAKIYAITQQEKSKNLLKHQGKEADLV